MAAAAAGAAGAERGTAANGLRMGGAAATAAERWENPRPELGGSPMVAAKPPHKTNDNDGHDGGNDDDDDDDDDEEEEEEELGPTSWQSSQPSPFASSLTSLRGATTLRFNLDKDSVVAKRQWKRRRRRQCAGEPEGGSVRCAEAGTAVDEGSVLLLSVAALPAAAAAAAPLLSILVLLVPPPQHATREQQRQAQPPPRQRAGQQPQQSGGRAAGVHAHGALPGLDALRRRRQRLHPGALGPSVRVEGGRRARPPLAEAPRVLLRRTWRRRRKE